MTQNTAIEITCVTCGCYACGCDDMRARVAELEATLQVVDDSVRHHLRSDVISAALIGPHAVKAVRAVLAKGREG